MLAALSCMAAFAVPPALIVGWGFLIGRFLLTRLSAPFLPWLAPALGLAFVAIIGPAAGTIGLPVRVIVWPMVVLAALGWLFGYRLGGWCRWFRAHGPALAVAGVAVLIPIIPLLLVGHLTTVGASVDAISYNARAEFVQRNALHIPQVEAGKPYLGWVAAQIGLLRVGDVYWLGLVSWVLGRRSFEVMTVIAAFGHAATVWGTYFFTRGALGQRRLTATLAAAFVAVNNTLIWPALDCSLSQVLALSFIPAIFAASGSLLRRPKARLAVTVGVLLSALAAVYPFFLVLIAGALGIHELLAVFAFPLQARRGARVAAGAIAAVTALAVNPVTWPRALRELLFVGGMVGHSGVAAAAAGNIFVFPPSAELFGLVSHAAAAYGIARWGTPVLPVWALAAAAAVLAIAALVRLTRTRRAPIVALAVVGVGLAVHQRFIVARPTGYPYGYFKAVTVLALLIAPLLAVGLTSAARRTRLRLVSMAVGAALLAISSLHTAWTVRYATTHLVATDGLLNAADAARRAAGRHPVEIDVSPGLEENWLGYLLSDSLVVFRRINAIHPVITPPLPEAPRFVLRELSTPSHVTVAGQPDGRPSRLLWSGGGFEVRQFLDSLLADWAAPNALWAKGATLQIRKGSGDSPVALDLAGQTWTGPLPQGKARTVQVIVSAMSSARLVETGEFLDVSPGSWMIDVDLACPMPIGIRMDAGTLTLGPTRILGDATGVAGRCVELFPSPVGSLTWRSHVSGTSLVIEAELVPPARSDPHPYRLAIHVGGGLPGRNDLYGVWSVDFPVDGGVHHALMEIDLPKREGRAEMDGVATAVLQTNRDVSIGQFEATMVLWRLVPIYQLYLGRALTFEVAPDTGLQFRALPRDGRYWWRSP